MGWLIIVMVSEQGPATIGRNLDLAFHIVA